MILDEITLYNFGLYSDRQTISLTPESARKPVVLFGGLNGGGKTTFLDALQLCLFGRHAKISNRGSLAYGEYLSRSIHRDAVEPEASIEIVFRHTSEGHEDSYRLHRSWHKVNGSCKEVFKVWKNGTADSVLAENWVTQVEDFVPPNIAHLFLFDGEQIEGYASSSHSSELIGTAIQNLLGLDMVDQLEKDLVVYGRRKRLEKKDEVVLEKIAVAESELRDCRRRADTLNQERAAIQTHDIDRMQRKLSRVNEEYRNLGGNLFDQRVALEQRLDDAESGVQKNEEAQREIAAGILPLLMVHPLLKSADMRDQHEEECQRARDISAVLQSRDRAALKTLRSHPVDEETIEAIKQFFRKDRAKRRALGKETTVLDLTLKTRSDLHSLLRGGLKDATSIACRKLEEHKSEQNWQHTLAQRSKVSPALIRSVKSQ